MKWRISVALFLVISIVLIIAFYNNPRRNYLPFNCEQLKRDALFEIGANTVTYQSIQDWIQLNYQEIDSTTISQYGSPTTKGYVGWSYQERYYLATFQNSQLFEVQVSLGYNDFSTGEIVSCIGEPIYYLATLRPDSATLSTFALAYPEKNTVFEGVLTASNYESLLTFNQNRDFDRIIVRLNDELLFTNFSWASWKLWESWDTIKVDIDPRLKDQLPAD